MTKHSFDTMKICDIDEVIKLENRNYSTPWSTGVMKDCIKAGYQCILMKQKEEIIAYAFLMANYDESHLLNMCVDKIHQGKGLGRQLLTYLENVCKYNQSKLFLLEVRQSNPIAQNLYTSFGFKKIGLRKNYYQCINGREDAIVMTKKVIYK